MNWSLTWFIGCFVAIALASYPVKGQINRKGAVQRFDTLIYEQSVAVKSGQTFRFPPGAHLLSIHWLNQTGASLITFSDGTTLKESPVNHSYFVETVGIYDEKTDNYSEFDVRYGDENWLQQCPESAKEVESITSRSGGEFRISYFTLQPQD